MPSFVSQIECPCTHAAAMKYALAGDTPLCHMLLTGSKGDKSWASAAYLEDKVRVAFGDSATETVWDILSQDNVVQRE